MANEVKTPIPARLYNAAVEGHVAGTEDIYDDTKGKTQKQINTEVEQSLGSGGSVDARIDQAKTDIIGGASSSGNTLKKIEDRVSPLEYAVGTGGSVDERIATEGAKHYLKSETYTKDEVHGLITTPNQQYITVTATAQTTAVTDVLPASGEADTVYRVGNWDGSAYDDTVYSEYAWNGSAYIKLSTKSQAGEVYDISANHSNNTYVDLAAALDGGNNIPQELRRGGMSIKFVQSSDNKYVQYRLTKNEWSTTEADWQGVDDEPTAGSDNLVKSGGVFESIGINEGLILLKSSSTNLLDVDTQIAGIKLQNSAPYFSKLPSGRISHLIPCQSLTKMTFSGFGSGDCCAYLTEAVISNDNKYMLGTYGLSGGTRTVDVLDNAKYCVVTIKGTSADNNKKVSATENVTGEDFVLDSVCLQPYVRNEVGEDNQGLLSEAFITRQFGGITANETLLRKSKTSCLLDSKSCIYGYAMASNTINIDSKGRCSHFIDCTGLSKITVSGARNSTAVIGYFVSKPLLSKEVFSSNKNYNLHYDDSRTLNVPANKPYFIIDYGIAGKVDISNIKVFAGESTTEDEFDLDSITLYSDKDKPIYLSNSQNILDITRYKTDKRITNSAPYFVSPGSDSVISEAFIVDGLKYITIKCDDNMSFAGSSGFLAFCTDDSRTEESVIEVVIGMDTTEKQKTLAVPDGAKFAFLMLNTSPTKDTLPWQNTKISRTDKPTSDAFVQGLIGYDNGTWYNTYNAVENKNSDYDNVKVIEKTLTEKRAAPYLIGIKPEDLTASSGDHVYNRFNFLFFTDSHIDLPVAVDNAKETVDFINDTNIPLDCVLNAGDFITPFGEPKAKAEALAEKYFSILKNSKLPVLQAIGNHDTNDWYNGPDRVLYDSDFDSLYFSWLRTNYTTVHNAGGSYAGQSYQSSYFYKDFDDAKIRVIVLNNQDIPHDASHTTSSGACIYYGTNAFYIRQEQFDWFVNTALNFSAKEYKDWGIIVCLHQDYHTGVLNHDLTEYVVPVNESAVKKMILTLKALNTQSSYSNSYTCQADSEFNLSINADFTSYASAEEKPYVIGVLCGHMHRDIYEQYEGINIITTLNASGIRDVNVPVNRVKGTPTQNAFDIISVDTKTRKLYITRHGAGTNCFGEGGDRFKPNGLSF